MKRLLSISLLFASLNLFGQGSTSIYSYQVTTNNGSIINLSSFQGKKILFVNTASNSQYVSQFASLEQLYDQDSSSLVVIAFPSNDFGNEPNTDSTIASMVYSQYNIHFILAATVSVSGSNQIPLYQWLTQSSLNGIINNAVQSDFFKFLVDSSGNPMGVFASNVDPMSSSLQAAINN